MQSHQGKIIISTCPGLAELRDTKDDWTAISSWQERRKRQNRLNQRAIRRRKQDAKSNPTPQETSADAISGAASLELTTSRHMGSQIAYAQGYRDTSYISVGEIGDAFRILPRRGDRDKARQLQVQAYLCYILRSPKPTFLPTLIRLNAMSAIAHNASMMGIPVEALCLDEALSPFSIMGPLLPLRSSSSQSTPTSETYPETLYPTEVQRSVVHHPWIDVLPLPRLRDNLIMASSSLEWFDEDELCLEVFHPGQHDAEDDKPALIVWGESWDFRGWEANVPFLKKWGWLLQGCPELIDSTNVWRLQRGERPLTWEQS